VNVLNWLGLLLELYIVLVMLPMVILSWFRVEPGTPLARIRYVLYRATEPVLRPVRRLIPPVSGIDFSVLVVMLVAQIVIIPILRS
jgi:YggT family protein